jgi:hypothetical protein
MRKFGFVLFAAAALLPAVAIADDSMATATPAAATAQPLDPNRIQCEYLYHEATFVRKPICMKASEWESNRSRIQRNFREIQIRSLVAPR